MAADCAKNVAVGLLKSPDCQPATRRAISAANDCHGANSDLPFIRPAARRRRLLAHVGRHRHHPKADRCPPHVGQRSVRHPDAACSERRQRLSGGGQATPVSKKQGADERSGKRNDGSLRNGATVRPARPRRLPVGHPRSSPASRPKLASESKRGRALFRLFRAELVQGKSHQPQILLPAVVVGHGAL